ncbi:hypothetical protein SORBI_3001G241600 [Sorghum bicolor]|uniref:BTB domain-containing protein n=2 Tax=Sorghum bicolor TaxID=4558 RepID=A0A1Z5S7N3_SORBI|nr:hypothetical protein SORBI_3001G241600 [Sorghum bicolor]
MSFAGVSFIGSGGLSGRSTPATAASLVTDSGYHLLVIDGYSRTRETTPNGDCIKSSPFRVGGHSWCIQYYPNGRVSEVADCIHLALVLDEHNIEEAVKVQFDFSLVDKAEKQLPSNIHETEVINFSNETPCYGCAFMNRNELEKSELLKDDSLTIKCDIMVIKDVDIDRTGANTAPFVVVPASDMIQHLSSLLQSTEGSDVTFEIGREIFAAHRCVLACRSTVFKGLLGSMNEGTTAGVVRIDDMEARVFKLLLGFIYRDSVPEKEAEDDDVMWQHLLVAADRYDLLRLRLICEQKLCTYINTTTAATILALAERHHGRGLKDACLDFLTRAHANLQEVTVLGGLDHLASTCPLVLKELIVKLVSPNKKARIDVNTAFVTVPASDMHQHFTHLLQSGEDTDVVFEVSGEKLHAHRCILAASDSMPDINEEEDMEEDEEKDDDVDDIEVTWQHLLVAADRYDLQRLRLMCENKLCGYINTTKVASILELAEQHHCRGLKEACLDFLNFPPNLQQVMAAGGLSHLSSSCPSVLIDLIAKLAYLKPSDEL